MKNLCFSIIIPCFNSIKNIENLLKHISNQIENKPIELIVIDDNSTDGTYNAIKKFESTQINIFKNNINSGPNISRNVGIKKAKGEFIVFLDSDDSFTTDAIEQILNYCKIGNFDILSYAFDFISRDKKLLSKHNFTNKEILGTDIVDQFLKGEIFSVCWNKIYRRDLLINNNIYFKEDMVHGRDALFTLDCCYFAKNLITVNNKLYLSIARDGSFSRSFSIKNIHSLIENVSIVNEKMQTYKLDNKLVNLYISKHVRYILLYSSFNFNLRTYLNALSLLYKSHALGKMFKLSVLKKTKPLEIFLSILVISPFLILPISYILKTIKYNPY